jgi:X-linked retinitis pigmentosa GTPase regulator
VSCGNHSAAISEEKELYIWGTGPFGQYFSPMKVINQKVKRVWTGTTFGLAEGISGELYSWGSNVSGQLGHGNS